METEQSYLKKLKTTNVIAFIVISTLTILLFIDFYYTIRFFSDGKINSSEYERITTSLIKESSYLVGFVMGYYFAKNSIEKEKDTKNEGTN